MSNWMLLHMTLHHRHVYLGGWSHWVSPGSTQWGHCPHWGFTLSLSLFPWQMDQVRAELAQERAARQGLECNKTSMERQVLVLSSVLGLVLVYDNIGSAFSQNRFLIPPETACVRLFFPRPRFTENTAVYIGSQQCWRHFLVTRLKLL